ncbi:MAG: type IV pilus assembly protein PilM [Deltaproteobacteria bacterium]|nr:type IV pilus assembly protein PilM [Deltaproteobacteria bacterium]
MFFDSLLRRPLIGLDIGVSGIKAVEIHHGHQCRLIAYNRVPLPWNSIQLDGDIKDRQALVEALKRLFRNGVFSSKKVVTGISGNSVMTKKITVPKMSEKELSHQLYFEAEQYLPFNIQDVNLDFAILGPTTTTGSTAMMDVLLVAAKKDYVRSVTSLVEEAGLVPAIIDTQAFALGNAFEFNYSHLTDHALGAANVIVDFGAGSTKLSVVEADKTVFAREFAQCGIGCTQRLAEKMAIQLPEAERLKIAQSTSPFVKPAIAEYVAEWVEEIVRTLDFFVSQSSERTLTGIYVCGGASQTDGLIQALESKVSAPVQPFNPIQNLAGSGKKMNAQAIREISFLGAVAVGLSLREPGDCQ